LRLLQQNFIELAPLETAPDLKKSIPTTT